MANDHVPVPPKAKRSVLNRKGKEHQQNCAGWISSKQPWPSNAHHILPVTCFNPIEVTPKDKMAYVRRCIWVSEWDINGGNRFPVSPKTSPKNNMVGLPLFSAYKNSYTTEPGKFKRVKYPVNKCMHNSRYGEHYLYNKEVRKWLNDELWSTLQEDKQKHQKQGKNILSKLEKGVKHFRAELKRRGSRATSNGIAGTIDCWVHKEDPQ